MKLQYVNWSTRIFSGFYESELYNSDTEYRLNELMQDEDHPETYELDFEPYERAVSEFAVELLKDYCITYAPDNIINSMDFVKLSSPRYYNFETDKLVIDVDFNLTKLKAYIKKYRADFNQYLKDNFTSYDGFISYVANNYNDFMSEYTFEPWNKEKCLNVMLEYYILRCIYDDNWNEIKECDRDTEYHYKLNETAFEYQMNYCKQVTEV